MGKYGIGLLQYDLSSSRHLVLLDGETTPRNVVSRDFPCSYVRHPVLVEKLEYGKVMVLDVNNVYNVDYFDTQYQPSSDTEQDDDYTGDDSFILEYAEAIDRMLDITTEVTCRICNTDVLERDANRSKNGSHYCNSCMLKTPASVNLE